MFHATLCRAGRSRAVRYQVVVAFMLGFATALTSVLVVLWRRRMYFTAALQLKPDAFAEAEPSSPRRSG